jgi:hypothetical protein
MHKPIPDEIKSLFSCFPVRETISIEKQVPPLSLLIPRRGFRGKR